jgi:NAD(P)-dependent dehydrogenase (short-subunit alcohol dehydrogenase family)
MKLKGKTALITGGSRGIGRETAMAFAREGAQLAINYFRNDERANQTLEELESLGHILVKGDVADPAQAKAMVNSVYEQFGKIDILVNNAATYKVHKIDEVDYDFWNEAWQKCLNVNLLGPANVSYCVSNLMKENGGGRIINISSRGAFRGEPDFPAYGASKAGLNSMSQSLAKRLAPYDIGVFVLAPGFVETEMAREILDGPTGDDIRNQSPFGRIASAKEVAETVLFLASDAPIFLSGGIIDINGASYLRN